LGFLPLGYGGFTRVDFQLGFLGKNLGLVGPELGPNLFLPPLFTASFGRKRAPRGGYDSSRGFGENLVSPRSWASRNVFPEISFFELL